MKKFPRVEQVGFLDRQKRKLEMAGGEFCGNATRCTAYLLLDGKPGKVRIRVSGASELLSAKIDRSDNTWAQMPLSAAKIRKVGDCLHCPLRRDYSSYYLPETIN
jgi:diaminopimelate epimerase